jgi:hypothetical protein
MNTVADAISRLDFTPTAETKNLDQKNWMMLTKCWCAFSTHAIQGNSINSTMDLNYVFANCSDKKNIYPLTVSEIAKEQTKDKILQQLKINIKFEETLIENNYVL